MIISGRPVRRDILLSCFAVYSRNLVDLTAEKSEKTSVLWEVGMVIRKSKLEQLCCAASLSDWFLGFEVNCERHDGVQGRCDHKLY